MVSVPQPEIGGIILAGTHPWGESTLDWIAPRPLLPVVGRPLVWYGLDWLRQAGIGHVSVCARGEVAAIRAGLAGQSATGLRISYVQDEMPRGPAGCIRDAADERPEDVFVVIEGALLPRADLGPILKAHLGARAALTIVAFRQQSFVGGPVQLKPAGIYIASRQALSLVPDNGYQDIKEVWIPRLHQHDCRVVPYIIDAAAVIPVTGLSSYLRASVAVLERAEALGTWGGDYRRVGQAWVHRTARVSASARLSELVLVGPEAWVESKTLVLGRTIIGPRSSVGTASILSDTVSWPQCRIGAGVITNRCILMAGSSLDAGLVARDTVFCGGRTETQVSTSGAHVDYWAMGYEATAEVVRSRSGSAPAAHAPSFEPAVLPGAVLSS